MSAKLTANDVREIMAILDASEFDELNIEMDGLKLNLRRNGAGEAESAPRAPTNGASHPPAQIAPPAEAPAVSHGATTVPSPMFGVFYRAPKPGAEPYVQPGQSVTPDTIIGIIEVMKLMNPVAAGIAGEVVAVVANDGQLVEFGDPLLTVRQG